MYVKNLLLVQILQMIKWLDKTIKFCSFVAIVTVD